MEFYVTEDLPGSVLELYWPQMNADEGRCEERAWSGCAEFLRSDTYPNFRFLLAARGGDGGRRTPGTAQAMSRRRETREHENARPARQWDQ